MKSALRFTILVIVLVTGSFALRAQDEELAAPSKALERVEQFKKIRLMEVLALDEQTSIKFFARYGKHQRLLQELRRKQVQSLAKVQSMRKAKAADSEYARLIEELQSLEGESRDAKLKYIDGICENLISYAALEHAVGKPLKSE